MTLDGAIREIEQAVKNTRFVRLARICETFFGPSRVRGSHHIFATPWPGSGLSLQTARGGKAKPYQVRQVLAALQRLREEAARGEEAEER